MLTALRAVRARLRAEPGFSMPEVLAAAAISVVLAASVTAVILSSMSLVSDNGLVVTAEHQAQKALTGFTTTARAADRVLATSSTAISYTYRGRSTCELHTYRLQGSTATNGKMELVHETTAISIPDQVPCSSVEAQLLSGTIAPQNTTVEVPSAGTSSAFHYYYTTGQAALVPGDTNFSVASAAAPCLLGGVELDLNIDVAARTPGGTTESGFAAFTNNTRGLGCPA